MKIIFLIDFFDGATSANNFPDRFLNKEFSKSHKRRNPSSIENGIVDGVEAEVGRYPYMVTLLQDDFAFCGGTLVEKDWVLSAAHCAGLATHVVIGHHNKTDYPDDAEVIKVKYEVLHPCYYSGTFNNLDAMMLKLWAPSTFDTVSLYNGSDDNTVAASRMFLLDIPFFGNLFPSNEDDLAEGTDVTVVGWGAVSEEGSTSDVLLEVEIQTVSNSDCRKDYRDVPNFRPLRSAISDEMICATADGRGPCYGDSGGPLLIKGADAMSDLQVGIVSWGVICGDSDHPAVFTSVANSHDFIVDTIENSVAPECIFPDDEDFDYGNCGVPNPCWIGDNDCDGSDYNTTACNFDGGDCAWCLFPDDGFDYTGCDHNVACVIGDGICQDKEFYPECNFGGGDCDTFCPYPDDGFDYSECKVRERCWLGDCDCNGEAFNTTECNFDGGDCLSDGRASSLSGLSKFVTTLLF